MLPGMRAIDFSNLRSPKRSFRNTSRHFIPRHRWKRFEAYAKRHGLSKTDTLRKAVNELISKDETSGKGT